MKKILSIAVLGVLMAGCGGSNLLSTVTGGYFDGNYPTGTLTDSGSSGSGLPTLNTNFKVVAGVITGHVTDSSGTSTNISGNVDNSGNFNAAIPFTAGSESLSGVVSLNGTTLSGSLAVTGAKTGTYSLSANLQ